jgi:uncharacterized protein YcfJ
MTSARHLLAALTGATAALAACTSSTVYEPRVGLAGADPVRYEEDLRGCRRYAEQVAYGGPRIYGSLVAGTIIGASFGAAFGGLFGSNAGLATSYGAESGTAAGAAGGAAAGHSAKADPPRAERQALVECLRNNGYEVLDRP